MDFEPEGMETVREKYGQLQGVVQTFNEKVGDVLSKAEVQFLHAYRAHMQSVHVEKQELEAKLREAEAQQANDTAVLALERDVEWYRGQKHQLEDQSAAMQKDILYLQEQFDALNKDRAFLSSQLKAVKKEQRLMLGAAGPSSTDKRRPKNKKVPALAIAGGPSSSNSVEPFGGGASLKAPRQRRSDGNGGATSAVAERSLVVAGGGGGESSNTPRDGEMVEVRRQIRAEKEKLLRGRAEINRLRSLVVDDKTMRAELEEFFLTAVDDLRKEGLREGRRRGGRGTGGGYMNLEGKGGGVPAPPPGAMLADGDEERDLTLLFDSLFPANGAGGKK